MTARKDTWAVAAERLAFWELGENSLKLVPEPP